jgi:pyruvate dehydrogenase E2 component (dihydrolipoyllysine-residue acetyltransferase)
LIHEFRLPDIGEGLSEAELLEWLVDVGDSVNEGDDVAMISTDKVNVDLPSPRSGVILELPWAIGDIVPVGAVFLRIGDAGEALPDATAGTTGPATDADAPVRPPQANRNIKAPPALRRYAKEQGVDLATVTPTGPGGQIMRADIDNYLQEQAKPVASGQAGTESYKLSGARLTAAKRLSESSRTLATTTQTFEVFADAILAEAKRLTGDGKEDTVRVTPLPIIAKCVANTLANHRKFNATIDEGINELNMHPEVNLGFAVDTQAGLIVPVVHNVAVREAIDLAADINDIAERARANKLALTDIRGATFTISSTGGLERTTMIATTPVINLPNVATLWVSRITDRPRVQSGQLEAGPIMACTLSFDHRYINGAEGMAFINDLNDAFTKL